MDFLTNFTKMEIEDIFGGEAFIVDDSCNDRLIVRLHNIPVGIAKNEYYDNVIHGFYVPISDRKEMIRVVNSFRSIMHLFHRLPISL